MKHDAALRTCFDVQTLVHSRSKDSRLFGLSLAKAEELARSYQVDPDSAWDDDSAVSRLDAGERVELLTQLGDTFQVIARATAQRGEDIGDKELTGQAERWRKLAESCFGKSGRKPTVQLQPAGGGQHDLPDMSKLDNADLYALASELVSESRYKHAVTVLNELTHRDSKNFMAWFWKATCYDNLGNHPLSVSAWTTCTALEPVFAVCHYNLGLARIRTKQFADAERSFDRAYGLDPKLTGALIKRGVAKMQQRNFAGAEDDFTQALEREGAPTLALFLRSTVRKEQGKAQPAKDDYAEAMKREPSDEGSYSTRGFAQLERDNKRVVAERGFAQLEHDNERALADLDQALKINPRNFEALNNKMVALERLNRLPEAVAVCDLFLTYYPDHTPARMTRGVYLARQGKIEAAVQDAQQCVKEGLTSGFLYYQIGSLYAQLSKRDAKYAAAAINMFKDAFHHGFDRPELFRTDPDLAPLKGDPQFKQLAAWAEFLSKFQPPTTAN